VDNSSGDVEEAMRRFVPHSIMACVDSGQSPKEAEECRRVTIMFIRVLDIQCEPFNYSLPESPLLVQRIMIEIYSVLHRYEGTVSRFQIDDKGTVLKIVFGFPLMAHEDDPVRAVHAAIEIRHNLKTMSVQSCIGIATGWTICGLVGNDVRLEYTAVGSSVILAARLMQNANCCVLVNEDTYKSSCGSAVFEKICSIKVKGRDDKIKVYRPVESERRITKKLVSVRDSEGILGRDTLIQELRTTLQQYMQDRQELGTAAPGRLVVLSGQAGIGKATVLRRFLGVMVDIGTVKVFKSSADAVETKTPYYPWKRIFAALLGVDGNNKASQFTTRACENALINVLEDKFPSKECSVFNDILPTLFPEEKGEHKLSAIDRRGKLHQMLALILNAVCATSPVSIVLHACQFCDNASMGLLRSLVSHCPAVLFVITTRSEGGFSELEDLEGDQLKIRHHPLPALSPELSVQLVKQTLGGQLDQAVADVVMDRTQGIPLYCVEFARLVKESPSGALSELPDTITGAVLLRIDRLLPAPKLILKIIAIAKRNVRAALIYDVVPSQFSSEDLQSELEYLVSVDILMRDRNGYCFRHEMVQEVVLGFLTFSQKRFLHKRIANFYVNAENEVSAATLALHFDFAAIGMSDAELDVPACKRAIWFLKVAAEEAMKANAIEDANRYLGRCHELMHMLPSSTDPFDLEMTLGLVDGNEGLLRQVLDQFRVNAEISIGKIEKAVAASLNVSTSAASVEESKKAADEASFEARSVASAASTLGAEGLSQSALAVDQALTDNSGAASCLEAVQKLKGDFVLLSDFINNNTSSKTTTSVVVGAPAPFLPAPSPA
jgi:hypothetical protein